MLVSCWILTCCQPHRVLSGRHVRLHVISFTFNPCMVMLFVDFNLHSYGRVCQRLGSDFSKPETKNEKQQQPYLIGCTWSVAAGSYKTSPKRPPIGQKRAEIKNEKQKVYLTGCNVISFIVVLVVVVVVLLLLFCFVLFVCFSTSSSPEGNSGGLVWVKPSSRKSSATHFYQCV